MNLSTKNSQAFFYHWQSTCRTCWTEVSHFSLYYHSTRQIKSGSLSARTCKPSFLWLNFHSLSHPIYSTIYLGERIDVFVIFSKSIDKKWNANSLIQDLNSGCQFHFYNDNHYDVRSLRTSIYKSIYYQ